MVCAPGNVHVNSVAADRPRRYSSRNSAFSTPSATAAMFVVERPTCSKKMPTLTTPVEGKVLGQVLHCGNNARLFWCAYLSPVFTAAYCSRLWVQLRRSNSRRAKRFKKRTEQPPAQLHSVGLCSFPAMQSFSGCSSEYLFFCLFCGCRPGSLKKYRNKPG